jgi:hypothetical protein
MVQRSTLLIIAIISSPLLLLGATIQSLLAQTNTSKPLPTKTVMVNGQSVQAPDFDQITIESFAPATSGGSITMPPEVVQLLGFDVSTSWTAGQEIETYLMLGSLVGMQPQQFSLQGIADLTGIPLDQYNLDDFQTMDWQSVNTLVEAIPGLGDEILRDVQPFADLFAQYAPYVSDGITVNDAIQLAPDVAELALGESLDLSQYKIADIPGLGEVKIGELANWAVTLLNGVPSLTQVHWNDFPVPPPGVIRTIAPLDFAWSKEEMVSLDALPHVASGSVEPHTGLVTLPVPPQVGKKMPYVEFADFFGRLGLTYGSRWFAAASQDVPGGYGTLKAVNDGKEPTGLATYGPVFKVGLGETDETKGQATFNIYFRYCMRTPFFDFGCTPYFIGPIPWIPSNEKDAVVITAGYSP